MSPSARKPKRNKMVGAFVTDEVKEKAMKRANELGLTMADYIRYLLNDGELPQDEEETTNKKGK